MQMPWTTVEALTKDGNIPWQGQDSGFIWLEENGIIMCDPKYTEVDFEPVAILTEEELYDTKYAEGIVSSEIFYCSALETNGRLEMSYT